MPGQVQPQPMGDAGGLRRQRPIRPAVRAPAGAPAAAHQPGADAAAPGAGRQLLRGGRHGRRRRPYERGFKECFEQFKRVVPGRTQLLYTHAGWTSEDAGQVVEALRYASAHCAKPASSGADHLVVHLYEGNAFGFDAAEALRAALRDSAILKLFTGATSTAQPGSPQKATAPDVIPHDWAARHVVDVVAQ